MTASYLSGSAGIVDTFTANNGIDKNNNVIQADFGEITTEKSWVIHDIENKQWEHFSKYLRPEIKKWYLKRIEEELTKEKLESLWANKLRTI